MLRGFSLTVAGNRTLNLRPMAVPILEMEKRGGMNRCGDRLTEPRDRNRLRVNNTDGKFLPPRFTTRPLASEVRRRTRGRILRKKYSPPCHPRLEMQPTCTFGEKEESARTLQAGEAQCVNGLSVAPWSIAGYTTCITVFVFTKKSNSSATLPTNLSPHHRYVSILLDRSPRNRFGIVGLSCGTGSPNARVDHPIQRALPKSSRRLLR
jgi:hypothetical protein